MHNLYVGEGSDSTGVPTKMLTMNGSLKISVYNPATIFGIHVSSTPIDVVYSEIVIATGQVRTLVSNMSTTTKNVSFLGRIKLLNANKQKP